jgi:hypothetical protein
VKGREIRPRKRNRKCSIQLKKKKDTENVVLYKIEFKDSEWILDLHSLVENQLKVNMIAIN